MQDTLTSNENIAEYASIFKVFFHMIIFFQTEDYCQSLFNVKLFYVFKILNLVHFCFVTQTLSIAIVATIDLYFSEDFEYILMKGVIL